MNQDYDAVYYWRREASARDLAARAHDSAVKRIHTEMADRYAERAKQVMQPSAHAANA